jgi:hypothetical protein
MVLFVVLGVIIFAVILGSVVLNIVLSNTALSRKHVGRVQAYYAALAGMNYGYERLSRNDDSTNWPMPASGTHYTNYICNSSFHPCPGYVVNDETLVRGIRQIAITVSERSDSACISHSPPVGVDACIMARVTYEPSEEDPTP